MADSSKTQANGVSYKDTLNLPHTEFPIRAQAAVDDPAMIIRWQQEKLYDRVSEKDATHAQGTFILHDGPPYANAHIHLGTAYNKMLKDIIVKSYRMMGYYAPVTPGWDCHGLPIELKVTSELPTLKGPELKKACRAYAHKWIDIQREEFKRLGVAFDWDHPYLTMSPSYEAATVRAFGSAVEQGYISRKNKTVPWCASCQTVLAAAEIEYQDRKDPSIYVAFGVAPQDAQRLFKKDKVSFLVWTTTPWTLPLNRAVFIKPKAEYVLLDIGSRSVLVGAPVADKVCATLGIEKKIVATCQAEDLVGLQVKHPFIDYTVPLLADVFVGLEEGTACVHSAPGCGPEDYEMGLRYGLEIYSPLTADGRYSQEIQPKELAGMEVSKALGWVIKTLQEHDTLVFKTSIKHSYPHCWRCRNGLMFRATKQWFCELHHHDLQKRALQAIENDIQFLPEATKNHLKASVSGRLEWCLSRQRTWGTPIIAVLCTSCDKEYLDSAMVEKVAQEIEKSGCEEWDALNVTDLVPKGYACSACGGTSFKKEKDILDVWFDSGISHYAVLYDNPKLAYPADVYLEGVDQHRGWFQSSLLTSLFLEKKPCVKTIITHGYTVDDQGRKMSKSLGNVIAPADMIERLGTDGLRLWTSSIERQGDVVVSQALLLNVQEVNRKIRNTCRFLLSNLYAFDKEKDAVPVNKLLLIDAYALEQLQAVSEKIKKAYKEKNLTVVFHALADYCAADLSSFYLDIIKDRLYTDQADGHARRSAQTVCWYIVDTLTRLMAPILSFTAEQVSDHYQKDKKDSIHLQLFADVPKNNESYVGTKEQWNLLLHIRSLVLKTLEQLRKKEFIKHSLEAGVALTMHTKNKNMLMLKDFFDLLERSGQSKEAFLKEFFIVSSCDIEEFEDAYEDDTYENEQDEETEDGVQLYSDDTLGLQVQAAHAAGSKCPRCWQWEVTSHKDGLCTRCQKVVARSIN